MSYKEFLLEKDNELAPYATKNLCTIGFDGELLDPDKFDLDEMGYRTWFRRDADKIRESKYFALLNYKTQIFLLPPEAITYRNRLTHTLTVLFIARTIAENLHLNTDLVEAISLGHDVGHTSCGHVVENMLNDFLESYFKSLDNGSPKDVLFKSGDVEKEFLMCPSIKDEMHFQHGRQSYRLLTKFGGLQLSNQISFGIMRHSRKCYATDEIFDIENINIGHSSFEAQVVRIADDIAWACHDFDDALKAIKPLITYGEVLKYSDQVYEIHDVLLKEKRFVKWINDVITHTKKLNLEPEGWKKGQKISMSPTMEKKWEATADFIKTKIHQHPEVDNANNEVKKSIDSLCNYYISVDKRGHHSPKKTEDLRRRVKNSFAKEISEDKDIENFLDNLSLERIFCDYISVLPDVKFEEWHNELFSTKLSILHFRSTPY